MGGGGAMRAAVKAAGIGMQNVGLRGLPDNFVVRKAVRPPESVLSSSAATAEDYGKLEVAASSKPATAAIAWELDDWEIAGYDVEEKPRLVFGPAPSLEESKEAACELRDALDMLYFPQSKSAASFHSVSPADEHSVVSECESEPVLDQDSVVSSVPNHAFQAFKLFKENAAAQSVVAAIASDPNVWNAVLENEALKEYLESEKKCIEAEEQGESVSSSADSSTVSDAANLSDLYTEFAENVKFAVAGWVSNMSAFFQELFGDTDIKTSTGSANWSPNSNTVRGSLFALASMVIMVVVLKRG